jgi:hypothetical protein
MRRLRFAPLALPILFPLAATAAGGCSADILGGGPTTSSSGGGGAPTSSASSTSSSTTASSSTSTTSSGQGGATTSSSSGGGGSGPVNPVCGAVELCDPDRLGFDDNCDGQVDEGCACLPGQAHFCFQGDPTYRGTPGCFDGTQTCTAQGAWGPCLGGFHATAADQCFLDHSAVPHVITTMPFAGVHLATGLGQFAQGGVPGSEAWQVDCPAGVTPCPATGGNGADWFMPLQSGQYTAHYTQSLVGGGTGSTSFPLIVGGIGLRVELSWEHTTADTGVDVDLHVHQPGNTQPWGISPAVAQDCTWSNCTFSNFTPPQGFDSPHWFADSPATPPTPVNWSNDPTPANNNCYDAPRGVGAEWAGLGMGCHSPRLDLDNITCDMGVSDPNDAAFCTPENVNIDYVPQGPWTRVGVHYYNNHGQTYDVHPRVRIFCDGALAGELGPAGFYVPESPVTFAPDDGANVGGNRFWLVADVQYQVGAYGSYCTVQPLYADAANLTPFLTLDSNAIADFGPAYPP